MVLSHKAQPHLDDHGLVGVDGVCHSWKVWNNIISIIIYYVCVSDLEYYSQR